MNEPLWHWLVVLAMGAAGLYVALFCCDAVYVILTRRHGLGLFRATLQELRDIARGM